MLIEDLISTAKSGVAQLTIIAAGNEISTGTGFLVSGCLVTNAHVIPTGQFDKIKIEFSSDPPVSMELSESNVASLTLERSEPTKYDYVVLTLPNDVTEELYNFEFESCDDVTEGEEVVFFGFPFSIKNLTSHSGRISSTFTHNEVHRFQVDGSINAGNSGGPLIRVKSGRCVGIVTRSLTGLERDFDALVDALGQNIQTLSNQRAMIQIGGIDPIEATRVTMSILGRIALQLKRSTNVGIGYAYCAEHISRACNFSDSSA